MSRGFDIQEGMQVYGGDQLVGRVEAVHGNGFHVNGLHYTREMVTHVEHNRVYLGDSGKGAGDGDDMIGEAGARGATVTATGARDSAMDAVMADAPARTVEDTASVRAATATDTVAARTDEMAAGELRIPVVEERLAVGKREVDLGAVEIRKTVTEEEQTASVTLRRDEVHVEEVDVADRPATGEDLFEEGTIRVQLRGEEAVVAKETVVTGEVVINKDTVAEERTTTDTVRKQRVEVEEHYQREQGGFEQLHAARAGGTGRAFAEAEPNYRTGFDAGYDERYAGREFTDIEPDLQRDYATRGVTGERWAELRREIAAGWDKARGQ